MVTRRLKKGSVYDALASSSGLDFSPVVQLKTFNPKKHERKTEMEDDTKRENDPPITINGPPLIAPKPASPKPEKPKPEADKCLTAHEKYPSWPVVDSESSSLPYRSHSWTSQTDYPKEKAGYSRPKKTHQYKISTNQLQPVLERGTAAAAAAEVPERRRSTEGYRQGKGAQQFDFEGFHTPCIPKCYSTINSPPERESPAKEDSNTFLSRYEDVLRQQAQFTTPPPPKKNVVPDTPFLDRLRFENAWAGPRPDFENSSENGTWMDSMESSSHGRVAKWQGSSSDLSTLSTQLSNRSSLFDSGHSTMPESGRLSPQSSCDSLLLEGPTRAQVVARHGCHREIVAHSARVQQPERYGSESVLYYATGQSTTLTKNGTAPSPDEALYCSNASLTLTSPRELENDLGKSPSRVSSNSFSSEDSITRAKYLVGEREDTSGSSSDVSNITCISNYNSLGKPVKIPTKSADSPAKLKPIVEPKPKKSVDETQKFIFPEVAKRQRISDPDLKVIQKQAVMSFYQRMSLAESIKSEGKPPTGHDSEPPPPYDAVCPVKKKLPPPKLSLPPKSQWPPRSISHTSPTLEQHPKFLDAGLSTNHSKSVPNLVSLKGHCLEVRPVGKGTLPPRNREFTIQRAQMMKDEIISWDELPKVKERKAKLAHKAPLDNEDKDQSLEEISSGYLKGVRKVHLKEVENSNKVQVVVTENVALSAKRRPAPPPPLKQPPKRPPPPPPPLTPPQQVVVHISDNKNEASLVRDTKEEEVNYLDGHSKSDNSALIYPKNSYMSYKSERKMSRQGFDGNYRRSSGDLTCVESSNFEQIHNIRQHGPTVIFHSVENNNSCEQPDDSSVPFQLPSPEVNSDVIVNCSLDSDLNQNSVEISNLPPKDANDLTRRINISRLHRKTEKTKEEYECERLSKEYVKLDGSAVLKCLLVPGPKQRKMPDYIKGILNVECDQNGYDCEEIVTQLQENQREVKFLNCEMSNSVPSTNIQTTLSNNSFEVNDNQNLEKKKEELTLSIGKKVESLKVLYTNIRADIAENDQLGKDITNRLKERAKPNEVEKFAQHVEDSEKIVNLLVCLANRLAKAENLVNNQSKECRKDDLRALEAKRDKLREQHEDACRLKENIDRRSNQVSTFLQRYFSEDEYASYNYFMKMKTKLIVEVRDVDDRINLGEEQLAYLNLVANNWKSTSS